MTLGRPGGKSLREQTRKFGSGKKVYGQGSTAPTRGTVKPGGYIKREMKKRGNMNQSQTRSGLAQQALRRTLRQDISQNRFGSAPKSLNDQQRKTLRTRVGNRLEKIGGKAENLRPKLRQNYSDNFGKMAGGTPGIPRTYGMLPGQNGGKNSYTGPQAGSAEAHQGKGNPMNSMPFPGSPDLAGNAPAYTPPDYVKINTNGQLDLPYDESFAWGMLDQKQNMNQQLLELQQAAQQQAMEYQRIKRDAGQDFEELGRDTLNGYAGRGMAFSSGYGNSVAENSNKYNQFLGDLESNNSLFQSQIAQQRGGIENAFNEFLRQGALEQALKLAPGAGDLGFDNTPINPSYDNVAPETKANRPVGTPSRLQQEALEAALRREISQNLFGKAPNKLKPKQKAKVSNRVKRRSEKIGSPANAKGDVKERYNNIIKSKKKAKK